MSAAGHAEAEPDGAAQQSQVSNVFNFKDADIILVSEDDDEPRLFKVHKLYLARYSSGFRDMFEVVAEPPAVSDASSMFTLPQIKMSESAQTLHNLLQLLYADDYPTVSLPDFDKIDVSSMIDLLYACSKYMLNTFRKLIEARLL